MSESFTVVPAYGRDYKSQSSVKADFLADKDFVISGYFHPYDGKPVNRSQIMPGTVVYFRYDNRRKVFRMKVK